MEKNADVVFVIDASDSMKPCFEQLKASIKSFVKPFQQQGFDSLRLGLLAYRTGAGNGDWVYRHSFICGDEPENMKDFYSDDEELKEKFFTRSGDGEVDTKTFCDCLDAIECSADEDSPLALDCAADFPFAPPCEARRAIVMFTDEKFEDGVLKEKAITNAKEYDLLEKVMEKLETRHISLFLFAPSSGAAEVISEFNRVVVTDVKDAHDRAEGESSWEGINFDKVLEGIGKSISTSNLQKTADDPYQPATYGQNKWSLEKWGKASDGGVIDITEQIEGVQLVTSEPIEWIKANMHWETPIDLDLHAFYTTRSGPVHIFYGNKIDENMNLDHDAGIGNKLDDPIKGNNETITIVKPDQILLVLFATKIYAEKGCFSDYRGRVEVTTNVNSQVPVHVQMVSDERKDWCVIAMLDNTDPEHPRLFPINKVIRDEPNVMDPTWKNWKNKK